MRPGGAPGVPAAGSAELQRYSHVRGIRANAAINADVGFKADGSGMVTNPLVTTGLAGAWEQTLPDTRPSRKLQPTLAQGTEIQFALNGVVVPLGFRDVVGGVTGILETIGSQPPTDDAFVWQGWLRSRGTGLRSARMFFGFRNNAQGVLGSTKVPARVGLMGDGVTGFRFGSLNCPDGAPGVNGFADIDAGTAVQPALLVNPGTKWFFVKIKLLPATPTQTGRIGCYLDGVLVATYSLTAQLPRGSNGTNRGFFPLAACCFADFDAVTQLDGWNAYNLEAYFTQDMTL